MGPLPYGPISKHIQCSLGPECDQSKFYITEYSTNHGVEGFLPRLGKHVGTGYKSNFRPGVYYSRKLDELDNPTVGKQLEDNYTSFSKKHFQTHKYASGSDVLPSQVHIKKSGFVKEVPQTLPAHKQVQGACFQQHFLREPKPRSLLHTVKNRSKTIEGENNWHGPEYMSTENKAQFLGETNKLMDTSTKTVGQKEGSGFTHSYNNEPITYRPNDCYDNQRNPPFQSNSVMKTSFTPHAHVEGKESCKLLSKRAERHTGYTREIKPIPEYASPGDEVYTKIKAVHPSVGKYRKKNDPAEYLNMVYATPYVSTTTKTFQGEQPNQPTNSYPESLGNKEESGYTENNCRYIESVETNNDLLRFDTIYKLRFFDKNKNSLNRARNMPHDSNGFTKSTQVHAFKENTGLENLHPYVSRSLLSRAPYYTTPDITKRMR